MRFRSTFLFLLLVAVPLGLIVWIGTLMTRQQEEQTRIASQSAIHQRLTNVAQMLDQEIRRLEEGFDTLLRETSPDEAALAALPRRQPFIRHAFLLDERGKLLFPAVSDTANTDTLGFLRRTGPIWESGVRLGEGASEENPESPAPSGDTYFKRADTRPLLDSKILSAPALAEVRSSGWHVWYYGTGPQLLFWQERTDGRVIGLEVEMAALLSLLVNRLSDDALPATPGLLRLVDSDGTSILHQNAGKPASAKNPQPDSGIACPAPLGMWRLEYFAAKDEGSISDRSPIFLGAAAAGIALIGLAWMFHRESTRDQREARRRVSFVNQVSHELKTPLTNIRLYTEMAIDGLHHGNEQESARHLSVVEAETSRLSRLIHNVLTFGNQQREQLSIHRRTAVLDDVVTRVVDTWSPGLTASGFSVEIHAAASTPFAFDAGAVEQILGNLLSNVEKYAASGNHVRITTDIDGETARLIVEDRGPGIPRKQRDEIFHPFVRLRNDLAEGVSGTGIGLTIARQLAQLHGGKLDVAEADPHGAKFILQLPVHSS